MKQKVTTLDDDVNEVTGENIWLWEHGHCHYSGDYRHTGKGNLVKMNPTSVKKEVLMEMMKMSQKGD